MSSALHTPLFEAHRKLGARLVEFAGFELPIQYTSIVREHEAVRERAGIFDVSHMGQIHLSGAEALAAAERLLSCHVASLRIGGVRYGLLCNPEGGVVDDVTLYRTAEDSMFLCVNAANIEKDYRWIVRHSPEPAGVRNRSTETGMLALQGPRAPEILSAVSGPEVSKLRRFGFATFDVAGARALVSRTGYTGSPGYELYLEAEATESVFWTLLERGEAHGLVPVGLGARDTLRLEAALPLYGHELDDDTSPLEAGLDRFVKRETGGFIGAEAIEARARTGHSRQLVGFELEARGVARAEYEILREGETVGRVTSGGPSPTLGKSIGLGYVPPSLAEPGSRFEISIRGRGIPARVVPTPFVSTRPTAEGRRDPG